MRVVVGVVRGAVLWQQAQAWGVMEWLESAVLPHSGAKMPSIATTRSCQHIGLKWALLPPSHTDLTYMIERRPDHNMNWKWTPVLEVQVPSLAQFSWNDTQVDARWEYTYRLRLLSSGHASNGTAVSYATAVVSPECLAWSDRALSPLYALRFRMETALPTALRVLAFLGILHVVLVLWQRYHDITYCPPSKPIKAKQLPQTTPPLRQKQHSCTSSTDSESSGHRDSDLSVVDRSSMMSMSSSWVARDSMEASSAQAVCKGCSKKFGLFRRKTMACTRCSSTLCRGCRRANKGLCICRSQE